MTQTFVMKELNCQMSMHEKKNYVFGNFSRPSRQCSMLTTETLEQVVKYVHNIVNNKDTRTTSNSERVNPGWNCIFSKIK